MLLRPRLLFFEKTRPRIEFERGYKFTYLLVHDACSVSIKKVPTLGLMRDHEESFLGRPIDPNGVEKATRMFLRAHFITERAKAQLEEIRMTFEMEKASEPQINAECVRLAAGVADPKLAKIPKRFTTREKALERYNAIRAALAEQDKAVADAKPEDTEVPAAPAPTKAKKQKQKQPTTTKESEEPEMAAKKTKGKTKATRKPRHDPSTKVKAIVKVDEVFSREGSERLKLLKKIAAAGARGIALDALGDYGNNIWALLKQKRIAIVK